MNFYVYVHRRLDTGEVFYVGKGKDKRAYDKRSRNRRWKFIVDKAGYGVEILSDSLTEQQAFDLEISTIKHYRGLGNNLCNVSDGGQGISGYVHTEEAKAKMSTAKAGKAQSEEHKAKRSAALKVKAVRCSNGMVFDSTGYAAKWVSGSDINHVYHPYQNTIAKCCKGICKTAYGYTWAYA